MVAFSSLLSKRRNQHHREGMAPPLLLVKALATISTILGSMIVVPCLMATRSSGSGAIRCWGTLLGSSVGLGFCVLPLAYIPTGVRFMAFMSIMWSIFSLSSANTFTVLFGCRCTSPPPPTTGLSHCVSCYGWGYGTAAVVCLLGHALVFTQFVQLSRGRMPPTWFRRSVALPAAVYYTCCTILLPVLPFAEVWLTPLKPELRTIPAMVALALALRGLWITIRVLPSARWDRLHVDLEQLEQGDTGITSKKVERVHPTALSKGGGSGIRSCYGRTLDEREDSENDESRNSVVPANTLTIVQITDPHLGPIMSVSRLRQICTQAVAHHPDLIFLTGDFFTAEAHADPFALQEALAPLQPLASRVFACLGNHDKEAPEVTRTLTRQLAACGFTLLVDAETTVATPLGRVQVVGLDNRYPHQGAAVHIVGVCERIPRRPECVLQVVMLHDPFGFQFVPQDRHALVLCGHTHGGMVGLLEFGIPWTFLRVLGVLDQGWFRHGSNLCYVHRGQGNRDLLGTFLLRLGVPCEQSVLLLHHRASSSSSSSSSPNANNATTTYHSNAQRSSTAAAAVGTSTAAGAALEDVPRSPPPSTETSPIVTSLTH